MRILLLNQYYAPDKAATAQLLADVGADLARDGFTVDAVCSDRAYASPDLRYPREEVIERVRVTRCPTTGFGRTTRLGRIVDYATFLLGAVRTLLGGARPDVVLCLSTPPMVAALGLVYARLAGAAFVYWVMDVYPDLAFELGVVRRGSLAGEVLRVLSTSLLRRADRVIALGEAMAERLHAASGIRPDVVHNWADGEAIRPLAASENELRREWGWSDRFVVLYSGNQGLAHEFDTVLAAAERLLDDERVVFAFVGGGPRREAVEREARRRRLANVEFRPYVDRELLGLSLTAGDVHLVTLRSSVAGLLVPSKIYGILAAGAPSVYVGPASGEIDDILKAGRCGVRVAIGDVDGLVRAIRAYASDRRLAAEHGRSARASFDRRFTRAIGVGSVRGVLEQAAAARAAGSRS